MEECSELWELPIHEETELVVCGTGSKILFPPLPSPIGATCTLHCGWRAVDGWIGAFNSYLKAVIPIEC